LAKVSFTPRTTDLLARAGAICDRRGARLTDVRRHVLGLVLDSPRPSGAYDMLDKLRAHHKGAAPPTIYRALDFLLEQGLIHKVERLSAFVGCVHGFEDDDDEEHIHHHAVQFLICKQCGRVQELSDKAIGKSLVRAALSTGFTLTGSTVEADGVCANCAGRSSEPGEAEAPQKAHSRI
jgi:Fur family zinc uptake transcriptional regulator